MAQKEQNKTLLKEVVLLDLENIKALLTKVLSGYELTKIEEESVKKTLEIYENRLKENFGWFQFFNSSAFEDWLNNIHDLKMICEESEFTKYKVAILKEILKQNQLTKNAH